MIMMMTHVRQALSLESLAWITPWKGSPVRSFTCCVIVINHFLLTNIVIIVSMVLMVIDSLAWITPWKGSPVRSFTWFLIVITHCLLLIDILTFIIITIIVIMIFSPSLDHHDHHGQFGLHFHDVNQGHHGHLGRHGHHQDYCHHDILTLMKP